MSRSILELRDVRLEYAAARSSAPVLDGLQLTVCAGELLSIIGPSGVGKTTLLHAVMGLIPTSSGTIDRRTEALALVFQRPRLLPWRTVLDNALYGLQCRGPIASADRERARALLDRMRLGGRESDYPHQLSEGMQQRVNLARALLIDPDLLLMDEPFAALDVMTRQQLHDDLLALWRERELTIVLVSHSLDEVVYLSDRVAVLGGRPATIREQVRIDLPRPRSTGLQDRLEFYRQVSSLHRTIERAQGE